MHKIWRTFRARNTDGAIPIMQSFETWVLANYDIAGDA